MNIENIMTRLRRMDWLMNMAVGVLIAMGIMFIYSAAFQSEEIPVTGFYRRQVVWALIGIGCYLGMTVWDYRRVAQLAVWIYALTMVLLLLVMVVGYEVYGANRWLLLFGVQIQPSEFAKLAVIISLACFWGRPGRDRQDWRGVVLTALMAGLPFVLIAMQPDLGTAAVLVPIALIILFVAGVPMKTLAILGLLVLMLLPVGWVTLSDYQRDRIMVFVDPGRDPLGAGWNKMQSQIAVGSGGLSGKGYLKGTQNILGFLPRTVAPTDFIYSVISEETGFAGSVLVLTMFGIILVCGVRASLAAKDKFGRLLAVGITAMLFTHVFVNIAMTIGLMPITGLPLPLMSYGGSFMLSCMIGLGLLQSIYTRRYHRW